MSPKRSKSFLVYDSAFGRGLNTTSSTRPRMSNRRTPGWAFASAPTSVVMMSASCTTTRLVTSLLAIDTDRCYRPGALGFLHRRRIALDEARLMPVWIGLGRLARGIERGDLLAGQRPSDGAEVLAQLRLVARADDDRGDRRALQQPVQRNLRHGLPGLLRDVIEGIDDSIQQVVRHRWPEVGGDLRAESRRLRQRRAAADLAGEAAPS